MTRNLATHWQVALLFAAVIMLQGCMSGFGWAHSTGSGQAGLTTKARRALSAEANCDSSWCPLCLCGE